MAGVGNRPVDALAARRAWGYDFRDGGGLVHPSRPDLMSYCWPQWVGDYHFTNALRYRLVVEGPPTLPGSTGAYEVTGRTAGGSTLFSLSFAMPEVADGDGSSSFAFVLPARTGWEGALASITLEGPGGSLVLDGDRDIPMAILRDQRTGQVRGFLRDPPPARAAMDAAGQASGPGLEVLFGRGIPGAAAWRR